MEKTKGDARRGSGSKRDRGISYIEILFAMVILTLGILGVAGAVSTAALDIYYGGRETVATEQAQAILERIRNAASYDDLLSYADAPPAGATTPRPAYVAQNLAGWRAGLQAGTPGGIAQGQGLVTITDQGAIPNRLALISITIDWPGRAGAAPPTFVTQVAEWP